MSDVGFFFDELTDFQKDLMQTAMKTFPKETKKFLKREGRSLKKHEQKIAKKDVGTTKGKKKNWKKSTSYHSNFDTSRVFEYSNGDIGVKGFNRARHAHLVENGHMQIPKKYKRKTTREGQRRQRELRLKTRGLKWVQGIHNIMAAGNEFKPIFVDDCEKFLSGELDKELKIK